jgi:cysteine synthase A
MAGINMAGRIAGRESKLLPSVLDAIGNTPLIDLSRLVANTPGAKGRIVAKLENLNPGLSKKDRIALQMLDEARERGDLRPGQTVCELTSGNTGTGLAIVCGVLGHPCVLVMSEGNSIERVRMMEALGAEVVLVPQLPGSKTGQVSGADLEQVFIAAEAVVEERDAFRADQFELKGNFNAHYFHTGPEMWHQADGGITAFCDFAGSGGTFGGVGMFLKEQSSEIKCYCIEPEGCAVYAGKDVIDPNHRIQVQPLTYPLQ